MRALTFLLVIVLFVSCKDANMNNESVISTNQYLIGTWSGEGRFLNKDFNKEVGVISIQIEIKEDYEINGIVGDAKFTNISIAEADYGFSIKGKLSTKIKETSKMDKDHFIILLVLPEENRADTQISNANFHLKSNYTFDFDMRVGAVDLKKNE